ncbi:MAG: nucleotidyl transferase AbiEii/AbiGii toxin family protein [Bacteroidota bacterium]|nr:nucleotidyl transferase AbiEii/AbiGii toxin family protein [Bacteroidota bacterium]
MSHHKNIVRIKTVHNNLADLKDKVVFVGGATVSLYADRQTLEVRPTDDVDVIIELINYNERAKLEEKLRSIGFQHDMESTVVCRFKIQGIIVDIMPTTPDSIGFSNKWYPEGFKNAIEYKIDDNNIVKILSSPYFIATKLEAFKGRGGGDGRTSQDFEDIVYVLENRQIIWEDLNNTKGEIRNYLINEFKFLKDNVNLFEWIDCHVEYGLPPVSYFILDEIEKFIGNQ